MVLWRWNRKKELWEYETEASDDNKKSVLRGVKRRNALSTVWRWREHDAGPPSRRPHTRVKKETL
jgi:hypothetical protein